MLAAACQMPVTEVNTHSAIVAKVTPANLFISADTSYNGFDKSPGLDGIDPSRGSIKVVESATKKRYETLLSAHEADYKALFNQPRINMNHTTPGFVLLLTLLASNLCIADQSKALSSKPNIIVFLVDDLGYGDLSCYGHPFMITPNIDQLASEGMRFTDCHAGSAICSPSRTALLTGRLPYRIGIWMLAGGNTHMQDKEVTIAEVLKEQEYQTFFTGKWHMSDFLKDQPGPAEQGFDKWMVRDSKQGLFHTDHGNVPFTDESSCQEVVDHSISLLKDRNKNQPFFMEIELREIQVESPTWPNQNKSRLLPINEGMQIGIPGAIK